MTEAKITVKQYLAALKENKLLGLKCHACGFVTTPPRLVCRRCGSWDNEPVQLSGCGKIVSFTSISIPPESHRGKAPYLVVMVELDEGSWIMGNICGADPANTSIEIIGQRVKMDNSLANREEGQEIAPLFVLA